MNEIHTPLIRRNEKCAILNSEVEGQCKITSIIPLRLSKYQVVLAVLFSLMTALLFTLACSWSKRLTKKFFFKVCTVAEASHFWIVNEDKTCNFTKKVIKEQIYFVNRKLKYIYYEDGNHFKPLEYQIQDISNNQILKQGLKGIEDHQKALLQYGPCKIEIPIPSIFTFLLKELTAPFYILQYASCVLWVLEGYFMLAIIMLSFSLVLTSLNFMLLISSVKKLREMALHKNQIKVLRPYSNHAAPILIESQDLVPGDVMIIEAKQMIPCDSLLISGELMMNEASLTGETIPVSKQQLKRNDNLFSLVDGKISCLYEGTKVILTKPLEHPYVLALVIRTGFCSFKGQIFRSVLYPKRQKFTFYNQAIKFLLGLAFIIVTIYFVELYRFIEVGLDTSIIIFRFGDAITWIIPPALPIFVSMCMSYSLLRLRKQNNIFGVDATKCLVAGKVNTVCFDKTGTLTTTNIEVYGYQLIQENDILIMSSVNYANQIQNKDEFIFQFFASCHSVIKDEGELLGDSLDVEMLNYSGYQITNSDSSNVKLSLTSKNNNLDILRINEFESGLQRMSVLVKHYESGKYYIFCKGSPEKINDISRQFSIPHNFKVCFDSLTMKGLRVLGMAYKEVQKVEVETYLVGERWKMEQDLNFLGLLIMENKLKSDTASVVNELSLSGLDLKIISGDNGLTTIQCARECNIINPNQPMLLVDYCDKLQQLQIEEVDRMASKEQEQISNESSDDTQSSKKNPTNEEVMKKLIRHLLQSNNTQKQYHLLHKLHRDMPINDDDEGENIEQLADQYGFAITGKAFDYFWSQSPQSTYANSKNSFAGFDEPLENISRFDINGHQTQQKVFTAIVQRAKVFARMRPEQKSQIIEHLQTLGKVVVMIGDGANDCSAIKQANVGISFAQSDASFAAPFSTQGQSISCVKYILLDGRAALTNTMEVFQYYIIASVIKYIGAMLIAIQAQNFSTFQMIYVNYVATLPFLGAICISEPSTKLVNRIPQDDMVKLPNQVTIYFHILMSSLGLSINYFYWRTQHWADDDTNTRGGYILQGEAQTSLFICCTIYFQANLLSLYTSSPFKKPIYKHKIIMSWWVLMTAINLYFFLDYANWMDKVLQLKNLQDHSIYMIYQLIISVAVSIVMLLIHENVIKRYLPCDQPLMSIKKPSKKAQK